MRFPIRYLVVFALTVGLVSLATGAAAAATATSASSADPGTNDVTVIYHGHNIVPTLASHYFCHTRDYPIVRCFDSQPEVEADLGLTEPLGSDQASQSTAMPDDITPASGVAYTIAYTNSNYGGTALTVYGAIAALGDIGWNDAISSIKSVNCGIQRYYVNANYSGSYWQNSCNVWSSDLGSYNDTFSSVINEA